jgi:hypothetical protein
LSRSNRMVRHDAIAELSFIDVARSLVGVASSCSRRLTEEDMLPRRLVDMIVTIEKGARCLFFVTFFLVLRRINSNAEFF